VKEDIKELIGNCSKYCGFQIAGSLEHGYLFFGDERAYTVMQANDADKGGRSTIGKMPYSLNLAISP
jgi:hypothetical protein